MGDVHRGILRHGSCALNRGQTLNPAHFDRRGLVVIHWRSFRSMSNKCFGYSETGCHRSYVWDIPGLGQSSFGRDEKA
jgi:hypothetical protein